MLAAAYVILVMLFRLDSAHITLKALRRAAAFFTRHKYRYRISPLDNFTAPLKHHVMDGAYLPPNGDQDEDGAARKRVGF